MHYAYAEVQSALNSQVRLWVTWIRRAALDFRVVRSGIHDLRPASKSGVADGQRNWRTFQAHNGDCD